MAPEEETQLIESARPTVLGVAHRLTRDHALAEDLAQEGLLKVVRWCRLRRKQPDNLTGWAVRVAVNGMLGALGRVIRRHDSHETTCDLSAMTDRFAAPHNQRADVCAADLTEAVRRRLRPRARAVFDELVELSADGLNARPVPLFILRRRSNLPKVTVWRIQAEIREAALEVLSA